MTGAEQAPTQSGFALPVLIGDVHLDMYGTRNTSRLRFGAGNRRATSRGRAPALLEAMGN